MSERRDIPDALRDAVERTMQATVGTRELAQGAASELSASVDELVKGAEKGLTRSGRTVRAAVEERLPATQEDVKAIRGELRRLGQRLQALEERLGEAPSTRGRTRKSAAGKSKSAAKSRSGASAKSKTAAKPKRATKAKPASSSKPRSAARAGARAKGPGKPQR